VDASLPDACHSRQLVENDLVATHTSAAGIYATGIIFPCANAAKGTQRCAII
jgi:uncharacterized oligopeptide transporter (OPT) family protein